MDRNLKNKSGNKTIRDLDKCSTHSHWRDWREPTRSLHTEAEKIQQGPVEGKSKGRLLNCLNFEGASPTLTKISREWKPYWLKVFITIFDQSVTDH